MDKGISRNLDTEHIPVSKLASLMESFTLKNSARQLADILERAENNNLSYREFLLDLLETEVKCRNDRRRKRNYAGAHFPRMSVPSMNSIRRNWKKASPPARSASSRN